MPKPNQTERIEAAIVTIRDQRVILSPDLAQIYGVEPRALNQAVKRNSGRFPPDFAFRVRWDEFADSQASRSQSVILKRGQNVKYAPLAFTEHGAVMAANVLNSPQAVQMSVFVVRAFVRLRKWAEGETVLASKIAELEKRISAHDQDVRAIVQAIRRLAIPPERARKHIGFLMRRTREPQ